MADTRASSLSTCADTSTSSPQHMEHPNSTSSTAGGMQQPTLQRLVVRNLPHDSTETEFIAYIRSKKSCSAFFTGAAAASADECTTATGSTQAVLTSFKAGKPQSKYKARGPVNATAFLLVETPQIALTIAATLDSIALHPTTDAATLMSVEYSPYQDVPTAPTWAPQVLPGSVFTDPTYLAFVQTATGSKEEAPPAPPADVVAAPADVTATSTKEGSGAMPQGVVNPTKASAAGGGGNVKEQLERWVEEQKALDESKKQTSLVKDVLANWFQKVPFGWERRKLEREQKATERAAASRPQQEKQQPKSSSRRSNQGAPTSVGPSNASGGPSASGAVASDAASGKNKKERRSKSSKEPHTKRDKTKKKNNSADKSSGAQMSGGTPVESSSSKPPRKEKKEKKPKKRTGAAASATDGTLAPDAKQGAAERTKKQKKPKEKASPSPGGSASAPSCRTREDEILEKQRSKDDKKRKMIEKEERRRRQEKVIKDANQRRTGAPSEAPAAVGGGSGGGGGDQRPHRGPPPGAVGGNKFTVSSTRKAPPLPTLPEQHRDPTASSPQGVWAPGASSQAQDPDRGERRPPPKRVVILRPPSAAPGTGQRPQ